MSILFDQYQRYKNAQIVIDSARKNGEVFKILEVGANEHRNLEKFLPKDNITYLDIDLPEELLKNPKYILGDATNMSFEDNSYDIIVALDVFEHIPINKKSDFIKELNRVASKFFIMCAPFKSKNVEDAEKRTNQVYKTIFGTDFRWLKEHEDIGLPDFNKTLDIVKSMNINYEVFSHGDINLWEKIMTAHFFSVIDQSLSEDFVLIHEYYDNNIFEFDYTENSYRKFIVGKKEDFKINIKKENKLSKEKNKELNDLIQVFNNLVTTKKQSLLSDQIISELRENIKSNIFSQVYLKQNNSYKEENSLIKKYIRYNGMSYNFIYDLSKFNNFDEIRLDPINARCIIKIENISLIDIDNKIIGADINDCETNASYIYNNLLIFETDDPNIYIKINSNNIKQISFDIDYVILDENYINIYKKLIFENLEFYNKTNELNTQLDSSNKNYEDMCNKFKELKKSEEETKLILKKTEQESNELKVNLSKTKQELTHFKEHYYVAINQREDLKRRLADAEKRYNEINNAFFWKITKPARKSSDVIQAFMKRYKYTRLFGKGIKSLKNNGFKTTWYKTKKKLFNVNSFKEINESFYLSDEEREEQENTVFSKNIKFSILVPLYNTPVKFLEEMILSVQNQTYKNWELCLADGSDSEHSYVSKTCDKFIKNDSRIKYKKLDKNYGISGNTNKCIDMATGDYLCLFDHDDILHPSVLFENMKVICEKNADFIYTDENTFHTTPSDAYCPHFKPDFSPDTLRSYNYICHFTTFSKELYNKVGSFNSKYDGSQDYDMILRLTEKAENIVHIPKILYYWRAHKNSVASEIGAKPYVIETAKKAISDHLKRVGLDGEVEESVVLSTYKINYKIIGSPKISILIPNKDHIEDLKKCLNSIFSKSTYKNYEIIIIENNSTEKETFEFYEQLNKNENIKVVYWNGEFNYSAINNYGFKYTSGDYIILLNNDIEIITPNWIEEMLMFAQRKDVGAVGAKLYYPDDTIQHAGVILGLGGVAGHSHKNYSRNDVGYFYRLTLVQNLSCVTAACLMVSRNIYDQVNGLDEGFKVAFNDVDFCMRIREAGYLNVFTPYAEAYHYESKSRGYEDTPEKQKRFKGEIYRFKARWRKELEKGDPYYNPNLTLDREDFTW